MVANYYIQSQTGHFRIRWSNLDYYYQIRRRNYFPLLSTFGL